MEVSRLGERTFNNVQDFAYFESDNPLDNTPVHPNHIY